MTNLVMCPAETRCPECDAINIVEVYVDVLCDFTCRVCGADDYTVEWDEPMTQETATRHRRKLQNKCPLYDWNLKPPKPITGTTKAPMRIRFPA